MDPVSELRLRILPTLEKWAAELRSTYPEVNVSVYDSPVGSLTDWQGHQWGLDCLVPAPLTQSDNVALSVQLNHLNREPMIVSADVVWGHPRAHVEADALPEAVAFSEESLAGVLGRLPELYTALQIALSRGTPPRDGG